MASTNAANFREEFKGTLKAVIGGHPAHNLIAGLGRPEQGGGESTWINGIDVEASDEASIASYASDPTLRKFYEMSGGSQTFANWLLTRTPNDGTVKIATLSEANRIEWGHSWSVTEDGDWISIVNPKSADMDVCARKIHKQLDVEFGKAVIAATVSRKVSGAGVAAIPMPASQVIGDLTYAQADVDSIPAVLHEKFGNAYMTPGSPVYCAVSTTLARNLKKNDSDLFRSRDFIASYKEFREGTLPTVEGITFIEMPKAMMEAIKPVEGTSSGDQTDHYFAWAPQAVAAVDYVPLKVEIAEDAGARFQEVGYVSQFIDFVRTDDKGVVVGDIVVP